MRDKVQWVAPKRVYNDSSAVTAKDSKLTAPRTSRAVRDLKHCMLQDKRHDWQAPRINFSDEILQVLSLPHHFGYAAVQSHKSQFCYAFNNTWSACIHSVVTYTDCNQVYMLTMQVSVSSLFTGIFLQPIWKLEFNVCKCPPQCTVVNWAERRHYITLNWRTHKFWRICMVRTTILQPRTMCSPLHWSAAAGAEVILFQRPRRVGTVLRQNVQSRSIVRYSQLLPKSGSVSHRNVQSTCF